MAISTRLASAAVRSGRAILPERASPFPARLVRRTKSRRRLAWAGLIPFHHLFVKNIRAAASLGFLLREFRAWCVKGRAASKAEEGTRDTEGLLRLFFQDYLSNPLGLIGPTQGLRRLSFGRGEKRLLINGLGNARQPSPTCVPPNMDRSLTLPQSPRRSSATSERRRDPTWPGTGLGAMPLPRLRLTPGSPAWRGEQSDTSLPYLRRRLPAHGAQHRATLKPGARLADAPFRSARQG
jgi:hypothetical protein